MPKRELVTPRTQSKRAASKEALKQMQILLDDDEDDDQPEILSDDDVIPVDVTPPPRKKYKLSHRKSSDGNERDVIVLKSITNHNVANTLELDCWVEDLMPAQLAYKNQLELEHQELQAKLDALMSSSNAELIYKNELTSVTEISNCIENALAGTPSQPNIILNNAASGTGPASYQLVMDPRLGLIVGAVTNTTPTTSVAAPKPAAPQPQPQPPQPQKVFQTTSKFQYTGAKATAVRTQRGRGRAATVTNSNPPPKPGIQLKQPAPKPVRGRPAIATQSYSSNVGAADKSRELPLKQNVGVVRTVTKKVISTLSNDDNNARYMPDTKEIAFNKLQGKTYPSLVVVARPQLRTTDVSADRAKLDNKVKGVLMHPPTKFTEWLIQQGLVRSEQKCALHSITQLKLGMYSDVSKFPYSGGYVWISECCPQRFVSVFSGSLFEGSPHPPMVILKLLYHWSCQTNIQNVTQWVKVENLYIKGLYTWLRAVCTVALHTHFQLMGGPGVKVEIGVISLGTTSQDGNQRQVKVEVLGVMETNNRHIRLKAVEPLSGSDKNYKKRFSKILEPLLQWVHPSSIIVTDFTVDKGTLQSMGFINVVQGPGNEFICSNRIIMDYLRRVVPRMFQNTLSLLSRQLIQQFLDELVWREWFGTSPLRAFDNLVMHLSEQTRFDSGQNLIVRLNKVSINPFKNWAIPVSKSGTPQIKVTATINQAETVQAVKKPKAKNKEDLKILDISRPPKSNSPDIPEQLVPLENYYYGTMDCKPSYTAPNDILLNIKCPLCKNVFNNNIQLMSHLFRHAAHNSNENIILCRYCLTSAANGQEFQKHITTSHPCETKHENGFVCLICETHYMNPFVLGKHMSKEHCPSELPYQCGTCGYRCSNHKQAIDHFYKNHNNGPTIQCPFCLKSTTVYSTARNLTQNVNFFVQHLQKHQRKQYARKCHKCNLWFVQKEVLKEHNAKMHVSQRGKPGLIPCYTPRGAVMVPKSKIDKYPGDADVINFNALTYNVPKHLLCKECNSPMDSLKHFPSFETCQNTNCQYSTCCTNAMQEHIAKCQKAQTETSALHTLPFEMYCVCGYSNIDGNHMAKHLAICEKKSAYPSLEDSKTASVTHSIMDVLGLVRKPEEVVATTVVETLETEKDSGNEPISVEDMFKSSSDQVETADEKVSEIEDTTTEDISELPSPMETDAEEQAE